MQEEERQVNAAPQNLLEQLPDSYKLPRFPIEIYMRPDWLDETSISEDVQ